MVGGCRWFLNFARPTSSPVAGSFFLNFLGPSPLQAFGITISVVPFIFAERRHTGVNGIENKNLQMGELFVGTRWMFFRYCKDLKCVPYEAINLNSPKWSTLLMGLQKDVPFRDPNTHAIRMVIGEGASQRGANRTWPGTSEKMDRFLLR